MSPEVLAVIAALGASALTACASLGVVALQERLRRTAADRRILADAVTEMLSRSLEVSLRAQSMGETMKIRSGLGESVDVLTHQRKPFDAQEMHDWMAQDMAPLDAAWSVLWARGDQELVRRANALLSACTDLIGVSTARMPAGTASARIRRNVVGERWTQEMLDEIQEARVAMAHAREQLAQYARQVLGLPPVQLLGHDKADEVAAADAPMLPAADESAATTPSA